MFWGMFRTAALVLVLFTSVGCGSSTPLPGRLNRAALRASHPRSLRGATPPVPQFRGLTSSSAMLGAFSLTGALIRDVIARDEGDRVQAAGAYDPAVAIKVELAKTLAKQFSLEVVEPSPGAAASDDDVEDLADRNKDVDLLLEVGTEAWGFVPVHAGAYGISYEGTLRLIDTRSRALIADGECTCSPSNSADAPNYEQLLARDAALLKDMFRSLERYCTDGYRTRILGIVGP